MLSICATCGFTQSFKNGAYVDKGKTFEVDKTLHQFTTTSAPEILYFSNELIAKIYTNSDFSVNSFFQDILNTTPTPSKAKFGSHNFAATMMNGTAVLFYTGASSNSSCIVSTSLADVELHDGIFYFNVTDNKVLVAALNGSFKSYSGKNKVIEVGPGFALIAAPTDRGILEAKVSFGSEKVKPDVVQKLINDSRDITRLKGSIMFTVIDGKLVGVIID